MRSDVHKPIGRFSVHRFPAVRGLQPGDHRIHHQQLVHQLTGALYAYRIALSCRRLVAIRAGNEQATVLGPSKSVTG